MDNDRHKEYKSAALVRNKKEKFFEKVCDLDLQGIVAKRKTAAYRATDKPSPYYIKIKNPKYSQAEGRQELFNPKPDRIAVPNV